MIQLKAELTATDQLFKNPNYVWLNVHFKKTFILHLLRRSPTVAVRGGIYTNPSPFGSKLLFILPC